MKARLPKSGIQNLLRAYPDAKKFVDLAKKVGFEDTLEKVASVTPPSAACSFLIAWVLYPAISIYGVDKVLTYPGGNELNEYWAIIRLHYCCLGDEYVYKLVQAYTGIDEVRKQLLYWSRNLDISEFEVFKNVASILYNIEAHDHIVQQNEDTLLDITEFEDPHSTLYNWCSH